MNKVFIITGANGFLGNNIIRKLPKDVQIRALVLPNDKLHSLDGLNCKIYKGDVTKKETLEDIFNVDTNCELYVIHCAAIVYIKTKYNPQVYDVNVNGTKNIVDMTLQKNAKLIYVNTVHSIPEKLNNSIMKEISEFDSSKVVGQYAKTKAEAANYVLKMVKEKNLNACIVQPSGIIGPYDFGNSHLTQLILDCANNKLRACVTGGYDFVDVRDVADGILNACKYGKPGQCYILSNRYVKVTELVNLICDALNHKKIRTLIPMWIAKFTAPLSEIYYKILKQPPLYTKYSLYTLTSNANFSNQKAKEELNFKNRDIKDTIYDTVKWLKEQNRIK